MAAVRRNGWAADPRLSARGMDIDYRSAELRTPFSRHYRSPDHLPFSASSSPSPSLLPPPPSPLVMGGRGVGLKICWLVDVTGVKERAFKAG